MARKQFGAVQILKGVNMLSIMIDIESLGNRPGAVILSIGAAAFDDRAIVARFHKTINTPTCLEAGLSIDPDTAAWWSTQSSDAQQLLDRAARFGESLGDVLLQFRHWFGQVHGETAWANGADFDLPILAHAYRACGLGGPPWRYTNTRCYRTLKNLRPDIALVRIGDHHDALHDAESQAMHAIILLRALQADTDASDAGQSAMFDP